MNEENGMLPCDAAMAARMESAAEGTGETGKITEVNHDARQDTQQQCGDAGDAKSNCK
jgi:hypothetical protein